MTGQLPIENCADFSTLMSSLAPATVADPSHDERVRGGRGQRRPRVEVRSNRVRYAGQSVLRRGKTGGGNFNQVCENIETNSIWGRHGITIHNWQVFTIPPPTPGRMDEG